jgi:two-component system chemotaxis sensor kinase CheA
MVMNLDPKLLKKLIETFKIELAERSQEITDALLALEKNNLSLSEQTKMIQNIFRCAHNIKGSSRSIGISDVGEIAHRMESLFSLVQAKKMQITSELIDLCLEAVDKMQAAVAAFLKEEPLKFDINHFINRFESLSTKTPETKTIIQSESEKNIAQPSSVDSTNKSDASQETIRVSLDKITQISSLMEEMQANKITTESYYQEINNLKYKMNKFVDIWKKLTQTYQNPTEKESIDVISKITHTCNDYVMEMNASLKTLHSNMRISVNELSILSNTLQDEIRMLRLVPADILLCTLPRYVRDLSRELNKNIQLKLIGADVKIDEMMLEGLKDPIIHLLRNAVDHGIELSETRVKHGKSEIAQITIEVKEEGEQVIIVITDDGLGIDVKNIASILKAKKIIPENEIALLNEDELIEYIFHPGFSTKDIITTVSGRGVGLDVVKSNITELKGQVKVSTAIGKGTTFTLIVPLTLASERGLLVNCATQTFVIPVSTVERVLAISEQDIVQVSGTQAITVDKSTIPLRSLANVLNLNNTNKIFSKKMNIVILRKGSQKVAMIVDDIIGEREIVIKSFNSPFSRVHFVAGGTLLDSNTVIIVLNQNDIIKAALGNVDYSPIEVQNINKKILKKSHILVVDDSITTRTLEKNILENKDYEVTVAVNGKDAWDLLQKQKFSLLITDVVMPIMDGFTLTDHVKKNENLRNMPVIIVTSLGSDEEKRRGIEVGADAYIVKNEFESGVLLDIVAQLI